MVPKEFFLFNFFLIEVQLIQTPVGISTLKKADTASVECLDAIFNETFKFTERSMIGFTITKTDENIFDIQEEVLRFLHHEGDATLELLSHPPQIEFQSSVICFKEYPGDDGKTCRKNFVLKESPDFYVVIASSFRELEKSLYIVYNSTGFNPFAEFLIYWRHYGRCNITYLLPVLRKYQMLKVILAEQDVTQDSVALYVLQLKLFGPGLCLEKSRFFSAGSCKNVKSHKRLKALLKSRIPRTFKNCTIETIAMKYEPFVIDDTEGIEINLLKQIEQYVNVTFIVNITREAEDWGDKVNGTWEGNLGEIINSLKFGIGNVGPEADRLEDFEFSRSYMSSALIWVVPIAENVKKWRVLTIIFTPELWSVVFGVLFLLSALFFSLSKVWNDHSFYYDLSGSFLASLQILISSSVHNTPKTYVVRLVFSGGLLFSLIVTCVYSSYLINVLTNVVREHQIQNEKDILDSGLIVGGLEEYQERFQTPETNDCLDDICERYLHFQGEKDTAMFWLKKVQDGKACTPLTELFVQYFMVNRFERIKNQTDSINERIKRIKLFIIPKPINFYSLAIVMNKGNPFKHALNKFLEKFVEAGLMYTLTVTYEDKFQRLKSIVTNVQEGPERLGIYHVQGPFAILGIGHCLAFFVFILEKLGELNVFPFFMRNSKHGRIIRRDPKNKNLFYDKKYGDMYGKNYPT